MTRPYEATRTGAPTGSTLTARNDNPDRSFIDQKFAVNPATFTGWPAVTPFGSPATVTFTTSAASPLSASSCSAYSASPVSKSARGWREVNSSTGSAVVAHRNVIPDVSIGSLIVLPPSPCGAGPSIGHRHPSQPAGTHCGR